MADDVDITVEDRALFVINDNAIHGSIRFQKYGFLLYKQHQLDLAEVKISFPVLSFYDDWKAHYYGPYSEQLREDIDNCINNDIIRRSVMPTSNRKKMRTYRLTMKGRARWRKLFMSIKEMKRFDERIKQLQKMQYYTLIRYVYNSYPSYTIRSKIKDHEMLSTFKN